MSNYPPPRPPADTLSYYSPTFPQPPRRPLSVSVIGWLAIIFGALGSLSPLCIIPSRMMMAHLPGYSNPFEDFLNGSPLLNIYQNVWQVIEWIVSVFMLACGIGCLKLKPWARPVMIGIGVYHIIAIAISVAITLGVILPRFNQFAATHPGNPAIRVTTTNIMMSEIIGAVLWLAFAAAILSYMTRPHVKEAFNPPAAIPPPPTA